MGRLTARECLAVLEERINNLILRFDKFEEAQEKLVEQVIENSKSINDLSHTVKNLVDKQKKAEEISLKWKLMIASTFISFILYIASEIIKGVIP